MAGQTVANAYVQIMPSMEGATENISNAVMPQMESIGDKAGGLFSGGLIGGIKGKAAAFSSAFAPMLAGGAAVLGVGKILLDIGQEFDSMTDTIILGTGASGEALDALCDSAKEIATTVPISFEGAGNIVQDLNTRMGMVGDDLENTGERVAALSELLGKSINMDSLTGSMNAFGVANDEVADKMDYLFGVSQSTGIGFDSLTSVLESNAPALQNLGFSLEQSANMAGLLDKAGMDANGTMSKMSKALVSLAKPGQSASDAFHDVIGEMQGYIEAGDTAAAIDVASKVFGTKGAAQFVGALQSGALSMDELTNAALGAGDGIMGTLDRTMDFPEKFELVKNKAKEAFEPLGGAMMDAANEGLDMLMGAMDSIDPTIFETLGNAVGSAAGIIGTAFEVAWSIAEPIVSLLMGAFGGLLDVASIAFGGIADVVSNTLGAAKDVAGNAGGAILDLLSGNFDGASEKASACFETIKDCISANLDIAEDTVANIADTIGKWLGFEGVGDKVRGVFDGIRSFMEDPIGKAKDFIKGAIDAIKGFFNVNLEFPHIKIPHFNISGGEIPWGIGGLGTAPEVSVDWYATGGIIDQATVIGVGEAGPEAVVPLLGQRMKPFTDAVSDNLTSDIDVSDIKRMLAENNQLLQEIIASMPQMWTEREFNRLVNRAVSA